MNSNMNNPTTIVYDDNIVTKIKEIIKKGLDKLESFIKSKTNPNLSLYNELECEFNEIISKLEELELWEERRYFLSIEDMVLYIVHENSHNPHFGFCSFALELLNFFIDMFKKNIEFYTTESGFDKAEFINHQKSYKKKYHEYRSIFYQGIYESSGKYSENELYEFLKGL